MWFENELSEIPRKVMGMREEKVYASARLLTKYEPCNSVASTALHVLNS